MADAASKTASQEPTAHHESRVIELCKYIEDEFTPPPQFAQMFAMYDMTGQEAIYQVIETLWL